MRNARSPVCETAYLSTPVEVYDEMMLTEYPKSFFAVSAQQHRVKRNPWSETAHTAHTAMLTKYPETAHTVLSTPKQHKQHRSLRGQEDWPQDLRFDPKR